MSLNALVYRSRASLPDEVIFRAVTRNKVTGEYYFPTTEHDGKFPPDLYIAREYWIGSVSGVAELREELTELSGGNPLMLVEKCFYSGTHSGDVIELERLPALELEIRSLLDERRAEISQHLYLVLKNMLELISTAKAENNPIVFV